MSEICFQIIWERKIRWGRNDTKIGHELITIEAG